MQNNTQESMVNLSNLSAQNNNDLSQDAIAFLLQHRIMPTVQLNQQDGYNMTQHSVQLSSLDAYCRDSFAEQKAKVQQLSETATRHEAKLETLLQDTAVLKSQASEHLAKKTDLLELRNELRNELTTGLNSLESRINSKFDALDVDNKLNNLKISLWKSFIAASVIICGAMYTLLIKTENDLRANIESNKVEIAEVRKEMKANHEDVSKQLAEIRSLLQEKQSTAKK
ncbi:hypothetical protein [Mannheimia pernigra]|uniref:hypothetical protein n=1 Tax=Mannheimia pernigra TaxID=111844 RepID=UPI00131962B7|nr:hypothetical protein [Mannheimia pernigra]QHB17885.1 hypothetical protein GM695_07530 [Mannheimia pernigra]